MAVAKKKQNVDNIIHNKAFWIIPIFVLLLFSCSPTKYIKEDEYFFEGFKVESDEKAVMQYSPEDYVKQKPNKKMLLIYPYASIYNIVDPAKYELREEKWKPKEDEMNRRRLEKGKETKEKFKISRWLRKIGEAPVIYNSVQTHKASQQITTLLKNKGYFNAKTSDSTTFNKEKKKASVVYKIKAGKPYKINIYRDSIEDSGIKDLIHSYFKNSQIRKGENVDVGFFDSEREKITALLLENGYYRFSKEYIFFDVDTFLGNNLADVLITIKSPVVINENNEKQIRPHQKFLFKDLSIFPDYQPAAIIERIGNTSISYDTVPGNNNVKFIIAKKNKFTPAVLTRGLTINEDSLYRASKAKSSFTYYSSLSNFRLINFDLFEPDSAKGIDDSGYYYLNTNIKLTPLTPQSFTVELEGNTTAGKFGMATNFLYQHLNIFGGAEIFDLKFKVELNNQEPGVSVSNSYFSETEYGVNAAIRFPNLLMPFSSKSFYLKYFPKTAFSLGYNFRYNASYKRAIFSTTYGYEWRTKNIVFHQLNPLEFSSVVLSDMNIEYLQDLMETGQLIEKYDHMILGSTYAYTFNNQSIRKNQNFHFFKMKFELAGNLLYLFHNAIDQTQLGYGEYQRNILSTLYQDSLESGEMTNEEFESEIDSLDQNNPGFYTLLGLPYAQYFKTEIDFRYYQIFDSKNQLVYRINPGVMVPYGNSFYSPQERRFFLGGAGSMRGWQARQLGPGSFNSSDSIASYQYGDVKLEMNLEYRFKLFWMIEGALFADAGNIWSLAKNETDESKKFDFNRFYKEIALAGGLGFRLDFTFFVFRFDFGIKLYDPSISDGSKWLGMSAFNKDQWTFNFGIGYPF